MKILRGSKETFCLNLHCLQKKKIDRNIMGDRLYIGPVNNFTLGVVQGGGVSEMFWIFCLRRFNISTRRFLVAVRLTFARILRQV